MPHLSRLKLSAALLLALVSVLYLQGLSGPLLFDDKAALSANALAKIDGRVFEEWRAASLSSNSGPLHRPIAMLTFAANYALAGSFHGPGVKGVNLVIHLLNGVLLYFVSLALLTALSAERRTGRAEWVALAAVALWLLHPLQVSTVLYAVQRMAQLATLFVLLGTLVFLRYRARWARSGAAAGELWAAALWLGLLTTLATLSKENGALLPWLLVVLEVVVFRGAWNGAPRAGLAWLGYILLLLPGLLLLLALAVNAEALLGGYARREFTLDERLLTQSRLLWRYLGWIVWPDVAAMGFQHDDIEVSKSLWRPATTLLAVLAWPLALLAAYMARRRRPLWLLALLFYLVGHSMESGVLPLEMVYEHRNYLPSTMICLLLADLLCTDSAGRYRARAAYATGAVLLVMASLLLVRVHTWADEITLSRVNVLNHPQSSRSNYFYANALLRRYRQREQLQLDEREVGQSLIVARHYFERMYETNSRDVAALVMLFYMDKQFFPALLSRVDWLEKLARLLAEKTMQASDWNALSTLMDCVAAGTCAGDAGRIADLLDTLSDRFPTSQHVFRYRYQLLAASASDGVMPVLQLARRYAPDRPWVYYGLLAQHVQSGDVAAMYEDAGHWLAADRLRLSLLPLQALFQAPAAGGDEAGDE